MIAFASFFLGLVVGVQPVTVVVGEPVSAVEFELDGEPVGRVEEKPWSVEIDFGRELEPHELVARALNARGEEIGTAKQWLNLPRPLAEVEILLERDRTGRATAARLTWGSLTGPRPTRVTLTFDRRPLSLDKTRRAVLPIYDARATHILSAELEFESDVVSRSDIVLGGASAGDAKSELTAVPLLLKKGGILPPVGELQGWFSSRGQALNVVAAEQGSAELVLVRDFGTDFAIDQLGYHGPFRELRLDRRDRIRIGWPVAKSIELAPLTRAELFETSRYLTSSEAGFYSMLTRLHYPHGHPLASRFADAVAVAGLTAYASRARRAVVLVLGGPQPDQSRYQPEAVRRYLARIHVPLHVWSLESTDGLSVSVWGEMQDISTLRKLSRAVSRLKEDLEAQHVVWLEGKHLPQDITLTEKAQGIELVK